MKIIIPMSGFGERFRRAGYPVPKPLIEIEGKPVIAHVVEMFPGETDFLFVCNQDHLENPEYCMRSTIHRHCPTGRVVGIASHKLGPVFAVRQIAHLLDPEEPVVVNYCDFTCYWNWDHFKSFVRLTGCTGAIPAYKGFHPHSLGNTNYAYLRESSGWVRDIQEKQPYTSNRMEEFASSGTYYFASARTMIDAFRAAMEQNLEVGGEYYVSLAYKPLLARNEPVAVYPLQHFMQWGTPEDVAEYNYWSTAFRAMISPPENALDADGAVIIPMAGAGQRFANEGYALAKPLIPVSGQPMVAQATHDLPPARHHVFVLRTDMPGHHEISVELKRLYPAAIISTIDCVTQGQLCTALIGLDALVDQLGGYSGRITIAACDNGALYDTARLKPLLDEQSADVIVWGARGYPNATRHPEMFGWIDADEGLIRSISVKVPLATPETDPVVLGTFTFRDAEQFRRVAGRLLDRNGRVGGEFYIDSCINDAIALGLQCHLFEVDAYLCWGTPNDLRTFEYWQSCFHKWPGHAYRLELDARIPAGQVEVLATRYRATTPELPAVPA